MADDTPDTDQIEHDLAETRARMDRRLDELGDRLAPNQLVNDALSHVSGGDGADFTLTLIAKAKANPIPAVLAGIGIAWLMASSETKRRPAEDLPTRLRSAEASVVQMNDEHPDVHASRLDDARGQVLGVARTSSDTAASYSQRTKDAMATAAQSATWTSHDLGNGASRSYARFSEQARNGGQALARSATSPAGSVIVIGAGAALVGLLAGALIPVSEQEEHALGGVASQLRTKGRDLAQDIVDRGAQVAGEAFGAAKGSAQAHGLTGERPVGELLGDLKSGELANHLKQATRELVDAGKSSLQSQLGNGTPEQN